MAGGAGHLDLLGRADVHRLRHLAVDGGERPQLAVTEAPGVQFGRFAHRRADEYQRVSVRGEAQGAQSLGLGAGHHLGDGTARGRHPVHRVAAPHLGGEEQGGGVGRPAKVLHPVVQGVGQDAGLVGPAVVDGQPEPVGLEAGPRLEPVGDVATVGRIERIAVEGRILRGEAAQRPVGHRVQPQIVVGGLLLVRVALGDDAQLESVGRERVAAVDAGRDGGRVDVAGGQVGDRARGDIHLQGVLALAVAVAGPVAVHEVVGQPGLEGALVQAVLDPFVAGVVGAALGEDLGGEDDRLAVGRPDRVGGAGGEPGQLARLAAVGGEQPELGAVAAGGDKQQGLAVGRPAGGAVRFVRGGEPAQAGAVQVDNVDIGVGGALDQVGCCDGEGDPAAVGRNLGIGDGLDPVQVGDRERRFGHLGGDCDQTDHYQQADGGQTFHGDLSCSG